MVQHPLLADWVVFFHLAFVAFVVLGGTLVVRWPRIAWVHVPSAIWGVWVELARWTCPLTPLENWLRGPAGYQGGFVSHYLLHALYPDRLPAGATVAFGMGVLIVNSVVYGAVIARSRHATRGT